MDNIQLLGIDASLIFWGAIVVLAALVELSTVALVSIWFVFGGIAAFIAGFLGYDFLTQTTIFVLLSLLLFLLTRPMVGKITRNPIPTNTDSLVGQSGKTIVEINDIQGTGRVMIQGQDWSAKSSNGTIIPVQQTVKIDKIEGVTLYVTPIANS